MKKKAKRVLSVIMLIFSILSLSSCYTDFYYDSLDEYIKQIKTNENGFSSFEIDHPQYFLPTKSFITDFQYLDGRYIFYEEDIFKFKKSHPSISILVLRYGEYAYSNAKTTMIDKLKNSDNIYYTYNDYNFYKNEKFMLYRGEQWFPKWFTMACFNDKEQKLCFIGFYCSSDSFVKKYANDMDGNWMSFIDDYYGEYYDFSK